MPKLKLESLLPGMVVTADVKNSDGMLLIPAGCALTDKQISMLDTWGVAEIQVERGEGMADIPAQELSPEAMRALAAELEALFWTPIDSSPVQKAVFELVLNRKARQMLPR